MELVAALVRMVVTIAVAIAVGSLVVRGVPYLAERSNRFGQVAMARIRLGSIVVGLALTVATPWVL